GITSTKVGNYDTHIANGDIHVTAAQKTEWSGKQDALTTAQLSAANSGITSTKVGNYDTHIANGDIHVTAAQKTEWSGKQDALNSSNSITIDGTTDTASLKTVATNSGFTIDTNGVQVTAGTANIVNGAVTTAKIADGGVTTAKIADLNVTTGKLAASAVTTAKIADSNVTTAKIADSNVTTAKIADGAVTAAKLGAEIQLYSGWNSGGTPTANATTVALVAPVHGS
ncbi:MAG: hypothetical protein J6W27_04840, partial [Alphaproteobacteria bacterium]|nr:hypothetical protein [Alphaproteobacteria bacterium]